MKRLATAIIALGLMSFRLLAAERAAPTDVPQIPLCMIGDSITWAEDGDYWRQYLLERLPALAFVGTHTGKLGYNHAGEGGNGTGAVLQRLGDIPDCSYYSLLIGTNDTGAPGVAVETQALGTAHRIVAIVQGLLKKPSLKKVFLCSILPCQTDNPRRDAANAATNVNLRRQLASFEQGKVVWVELEKPIRAIENWGPMIRLHPTREGYQLLAKLLADAVAADLGVTNRAAVPKPRPGCGVRVENLWAGDSHGSTSAPLIAGWYTASFDVLDQAGATAAVTIQSVPQTVRNPKAVHWFHQSFPIPPTNAGKRVTLNFFTGYEYYTYTRSRLTMAATNCDIARILIEKQRPSGKASVYGQGRYVDTTTPPQPGELLEWP